MLQYMAARLWAELNFTLPHGKVNRTKEIAFLTNTIAGKHVIHHSGFWKLVRDYEKAQGSEDIKMKRVRLKRGKAATITRAIGSDLASATEHVMGTSWFTNDELKAKASDALSAIKK